MDAIYVRQSIDKSEYSISIESQIEDCKGLVATGGRYEVYADRGFSGKNTDRPEFNRMMADIENGLVENVIVWKLDRISRSVADFAQMMAKFKSHNVKFISKNEPIVNTGNSALSEAIYGILMVFAQFERETIQMRVTENYYARGQQGFYLGARAPFGYTKVETTLMGKKTKKLEPLPEQVEIVKQMYELYGNGGVSLGQVQKWLHEKDIKTVKGNYFQKHAITRILGNPIYVKADMDVYTFLQSKGVKINNQPGDYIGENGIFLYGKTKGVAREKYAADGEEYATIGLHKGIISSELWLRVQDKLLNNHNFGSSGTGAKSWLSGLVRCGCCGKAICFKDGGRPGSKIYTICIGRIEKYCYGRQKALTSDTLEQIVEGQLLAYLKKLKVKTSKAKDNFSPQINALKATIREKEKEINDYIKQVRFANKALIDEIGIIVERVKGERNALSEELNRLTVQAKAPEFGGYDIDKVIAEWPDMSMDERKSIAKVFIKQITVTDDEINVIFY